MTTTTHSTIKNLDKRPMSYCPTAIVIDINQNGVSKRTYLLLIFSDSKNKPCVIITTSNMSIYKLKLKIISPNMIPCISQTLKVTFNILCESKC